MQATTRTVLGIAAGLATAICLLSAPASAADKLRVGKAVPEAFSFVPVDIGIRTGIFKKNNLDIESIAFAGDARMQQAAAADSIDVLLGSGPAMAFIVKGAPIKGNRPECACHLSRDIGAYDTCPHGCVYCYAVRNRELALSRYREHDPADEFLYRQTVKE